MRRLLTIVCLLLPSLAFAQAGQGGAIKLGGKVSFGGNPGATVTPPVPTAENLYCGPGDTPLFGTNDGPATLPTACVYTALSGSPSPGVTVTATSSADFTAKLAAAACGDTILLQASTTYTGNWTLPAKSCDISHWVTISTDQIANPSFPPEGVRATPCEIGFSPLTDYPNFTCPNPAVRMPTLATATTNTPIFTAAAGANFYRFIGLNTTTSTSSLAVSNKLFFLVGSDHIIIDRSLCHAWAWTQALHPTGMLQGCVNTAGATNIAIINSWLYDTYCLGICSDSNAIAGGNGTANEGPIKVYNNLVASAAESWIWGGTGGTTEVPHDFEIRSNHSFKPLSWYLPYSTFTLTPNVGLVKNLGELKNGIRSLWEGNVFENSFSGWQTDQKANAVLLTPKSQGGTSPDIRVNDVTFRYNKIMRAATGIQAALTKDVSCTIPGCIPNGPALINISIHDNLIQDLNYLLSSNSGTNLTVNGINFSDSLPSLPSTGILIDHNTVIVFGGNGSHAGVLGIGDATGGATGTNYLANTTITNNLGMAGIWPFGDSNQTIINPPVTGFNYIFSPARNGVGSTLTFAKNALGISQWTGQSSDCQGSQGSQTNCATAGIYPSTNFVCGTSGETCFPVGTTFQNNFVNFNNFYGGDYHLTVGSHFKSAGTDGKDLGVDFATLDTLLVGVSSSTTYLPLSVLTSSVPAGVLSVAYTTTALSSTAGAGPMHRWSVISGALPGGITLSPAGVLSGTPTASGTFNFTVQTEDYSQQIGTQALTIIVTAFSSNNVFIAATAAGANTGVDCANAKAISYFNTAGSWSATPSGILIGPDTTVHLCGTFTASAGADSYLQMQGPGTSGHPVILKWENGAIVQAPYFNAAHGGIDGNAKSFITLDGGTNGILQNTANGTALANQQQSQLVQCSGCSGWTIKNLHIGPVYIHTSTGSDGGSTYGINFQGGSNNTFGPSNTITDADNGILYGFGANVSGIRITGNTFTADNQSAQVGNTAAFTLTDFSFDNNDCSGWANWANSAFHHNCLHTFTVSSAGKITGNFLVYNNFAHGTIGNSATSYFFFENNTGGISDGPVFFNNVLNHNVTTDAAPNGLVYAQMNTGRIYNNTILDGGGTGGNGWNCLDLAASSWVINNNIFQGCNVYIYLEGSNTFSSDYNEYFGGPPNWDYQGVFKTTFATWKSACSCDANSNVSDPNLNGSFIPVPTSGAIGAGSDLSGLGITALNSDKAGNARSAPWTIGALNP